MHRCPEEEDTGDHVPAFFMISEKRGTFRAALHPDTSAGVPSQKETVHLLDSRTIWVRLSRGTANSVYIKRKGDSLGT